MEATAIPGDQKIMERKAIFWAQTCRTRYLPLLLLRLGSYLLCDTAELTGWAKTPVQLGGCSVLFMFAPLWCELATALKALM